MSYLTYDVLETFPNWSDDPKQFFGRSMVVLDNQTGLAVVKTRTVTPIQSITAMFTLTDRAAITAFRTFLEARRGRAVPFWMPTRQGDLWATHTLTTGQTALTVLDVGYTSTLFPLNARKHVALITAANTVYARGVSNSVDNGNGTETLTLNASLPEDLVQDQSLACYLTLCRLGRDDVEWRWVGKDIAHVELEIVELPREAPAP